MKKSEVNKGRYSKEEINPKGNQSTEFSVGRRVPLFLPPPPPGAYSVVAPWSLPLMHTWGGPPGWGLEWVADRRDKALSFS